MFLANRLVPRFCPVGVWLEDFGVRCRQLLRCVSIIFIRAYAEKL